MGGIPEGSISCLDQQVWNMRSSSASSHWAGVKFHLVFLLCLDFVCGCVRDAAHLLLAVKVAARATPGSLFFRLVGESMLPVLRELECCGKALGWSSLRKKTYSYCTIWHHSATVQFDSLNMTWQTLDMMVKRENYLEQNFTQLIFNCLKEMTNKPLCLNKYQDVPCGLVWCRLAEASQLLASIWTAVKQGQVVLTLVRTGEHTNPSEVMITVLHGTILHYTFSHCTSTRWENVSVAAVHWDDYFKCLLREEKQFWVQFPFSLSSAVHNTQRGDLKSWPLVAALVIKCCHDSCRNGAHPHLFIPLKHWNSVWSSWPSAKRNSIMECM